MKTVKRTLAIVLAALLSLGIFTVGASASSLEFQRDYANAHAIVFLSELIVDESALKDEYSVEDFMAAMADEMQAFSPYANNVGAAEAHWDEHGNLDALFGDIVASADAHLTEMLTEQGYEDYYTVVELIVKINYDYTLAIETMSVFEEKTYNHAYNYAAGYTEKPANMTDAQAEEFIAAYNKANRQSDVTSEDEGATISDRALAAQSQCKAMKI